MILAQFTSLRYQEIGLAPSPDRGGVNQWAPFGSMPCVASAELRVWLVSPAKGEVVLVAFLRSVLA
jgi:hypothetical protein